MRRGETIFDIDPHLQVRLSEVCMLLKETYHPHENARIIYPDIVAKWLAVIFFVCEKRILKNVHVHLYHMTTVHGYLLKLFLFKMILNYILVCSSHKCNFSI